MLAVLAFELRCARRSLLVWLCAAAVLGVGGALYTRFAMLHAAGYAPAPRFALPSFGLFALWVALPGLVAFTAGLRARDERARVAEALDSRPLSNLALLCGRTVAAVLPAWASLLALGIALLLGGAVAGRFGWTWLGESPQLAALAAFLVVDAPATLLFWAALTTLAAAALRGTAAVTATVFGVMALAYFGLLHTPMRFLPAVAGVANLGLAGSDILPRAPAAVDVAQRLALVLLAVSALAAAAMWTRRRDHARRPRQRAWALGLAVAGTGVVGLLCMQAAAAAGEQRAWTQARLALRDAPRVDVERLAGRVDIDPGRALALDLTLRVRAPAEPGPEPMRFSLNPGLAVASVTVDGQPVDYGFDLGLLTVPPPAAADEAVTVGIRASGRPDPRFGYPDSAAAASDESLLGSGLALMGERASVFEPGFVALPPGAHWLPRADVGYSGSLEAADRRDYRAIDLDVHAPPGWTLAGAGRDAAGAEAGARFRPNTPLADFALLAVPWRAERTVIGGVECELLLHPAHAEQLERVRDFAGPLVERYERKLRAVTRDGFGYGLGPAGTAPVFSVVEAPAALRRYGGGRWMEVVQALPGVHLLAEHGFPTARLHEAAVEAVAAWLDFRFGANRFPLADGVWRSLLPFLASATGDAGPRLNRLLDLLTKHHWNLGASAGLSSDLGGPAGFSAATLTPAWQQTGLPRALHRLLGAVWVGILPPEVAGDAKYLAAALAGPAMVGGGGGDIGTVLALLRTRHAGGHFTRADFLDALTQEFPEFAPIVDGWLADAGLPGFVAEARAYRLPDDSRGAARYQLLVQVRNTGRADGYVRLLWRMHGLAALPGASAAVAAGATVELGHVQWAPPVEAKLDTFLSLNRGGVRLPLPQVDPQVIVSEEPFSGARPSSWTPRTDPNEVVVDDLDEAFLTESVITPGLRFTRRVVRAAGPDVPTRTMSASQWQRQKYHYIFSWGRYERTLVTIEPGTGESVATFRAVLPSAGRWRLAHHLPGPSLYSGSFIEDGPEFIRKHYDPRGLGTFDIHVHTGGRSVPVSFDGTDAVPGWNALGIFDLPAGEVRVTVSDRTSGDCVVVDAIRWLPADEQMPMPTAAKDQAQS